jgi:hypothetical protein
MIVRQMADGRWAVCFKRHTFHQRVALHQFEHLIKGVGNSGCGLNSHITFPAQFFGKKVRLVVEVVR